VRILLANSTAYPTIGGVENSLRYIGRELLRLGHEVKIFCFQTSADQPLRTEDEGIKIFRYLYTPSRWPHIRMRQQVELVRREIQPLLHEFQPDSVWSRSAPVGLGIAFSGYQGALLHIFCTTASMDCRGLYLQSSGMPWCRRMMLFGLYPLHYQMACRIERKLLTRCRPIVFSKNMCIQLRQRSSRHGDGIRVIPPGVDAEVFSPQSGARFFKHIEETYSLTPDVPHVLYVGRFSAAKNLSLLIDAVARLDSSVKLVLVGSGPEENRLRVYARRRKLASRVIFTGSQYEWLPGFYTLARVSVLPTTIESFGQVYLESLACGTPVIGFAGDGQRILTATDEIVKDRITGAVVRKVSPSALAEKMDSILSLDDDAYAVMSQRAQEDVRERFSWARFVNKLLALSALPAAEAR
jgi:1,2-diacylglycerol 3-alpha-glucosyltransferase